MYYFDYGFHYVLELPLITISDAVFKRWEAIYISIAFMITTEGLIHVYNEAYDDDYFEDPLSHKHYGVKYWIVAGNTLFFFFLNTL